MSMQHEKIKTKYFEALGIRRDEDENPYVELEFKEN